MEYVILNQIYKELVKELQDEEESVFDNMISDKRRLNRYNLMEWSRDLVHLSCIGVWPGMGALRY